MNIQHVITDKFLNSFKDAAKLIKDATILDFGCGDAYASRTFIDLGAKVVYAYDPYIKSTDTIDTMDKVHRIKTLFLSLAETYDIVWMHHVIEHLENPVVELRLIHTLLKSDGQLWLGCPNTGNCHTYSEGHINNFTLSNLVQVLYRAGFDAERMSWWVEPGQLRVRIHKSEPSAYLPKPMHDAFIKNKHFDLEQLPKKWRW